MAKQALDGAFSREKFFGQGTYRYLNLGRGHGRSSWQKSGNQFPSEEDVPGFREATEDYVNAMSSLVQKIMLPVYAKALKIDLGEFRRIFSDPGEFLVMNYFPPRPIEEEDWNGLAMHADCVFLTVVAQNGIPGLQIMLKDGEWLDVSAPEGCFLVNTGEFLHRLTNGRWRNTVHKVVPPHGEQHRHSMAYAFHMDKELCSREDQVKTRLSLRGPVGGSRSG